MHIENPELYLFLALHAELGRRARSRLVDGLLRYDTLDAGLGALLSAHPPSTASWTLARRRMRRMRILGVRAVAVTSFPPWLRAIPRPPAALFVRGNPTLISQRGTSIVGSRRASHAGTRWADAWARQIAAEGGLIVSGGAAGIDSVAHRAAVDARLPTVAYMGCAADQIYPAHNKPLFAEILRWGGALVTEHPPLSTTFPSAHAERNRFIAGQSQALYIAEAGLRSGTVGTAKFAQKLGREIYVPDPDTVRVSEGLRALLETTRAEIRAHPPSTLG